MAQEVCRTAKDCRKSKGPLVFLMALVVCFGACGGGVLPTGAPASQGSGALLEAVLNGIERNYVDVGSIRAVNMLQAGCARLSQEVSGGDVQIQQQARQLWVSFPWQGRAVRAQLAFQREMTGAERKHFLMSGFRAIVQSLQGDRGALNSAPLAWEVSFARGVVESLDRYSMLMSPAMVDRHVAGLAPSWSSWGFQAQQTQGLWVVGKVDAGSEAAQKGVTAGDVVIRVNGRSAKKDPGWLLPLAQQQLDVCFVKPANVSQEKCVTLNAIVHANRPVDAVSVQGTDRIGYLRLQSFSQGIAEETEKILCADVGKKNMPWVLDLRGNLGGYVDEARRLLRLWVRKPTAFWMQNQNKIEKISIEPSPTCFSDRPLVVLVDRSTASAAELMAGVLQREGRALILGERTYGKGFAQRRVSLPEGYHMLLTTEKWLLPDLSYLPTTGLTPDVFWQGSGRREGGNPAWVAWSHVEPGPPPRCATLFIGEANPLERQLCPQTEKIRPGEDWEKQAARALALLLRDESELLQRLIAAREQNKIGQS